MVKYRIVSNGKVYKIEIEKRTSDKRGRFSTVEWVSVDYRGDILDRLNFNDPYFYRTEAEAQCHALKLFGSTAERHREWRVV